MTKLIINSLPYPVIIYLKIPGNKKALDLNIHHIIYIQ